MRRIILLCSVFILFVTGCGKDTFQPEAFFFFHGEMLSLVDQRKNDYSKEFGIQYTLGLTDFRPEESIFDNYIKSYQSVTDRTGHIVLTKRTRLYVRYSSTDMKTSIPISELYKVIKPTGGGDYPKVEFWVTPLKKNDSYIEAIEVVLLQ